jgi:hypothetical protein
MKNASKDIAVMTLTGKTLLMNDERTGRRSVTLKTNREYASSS